MTANNHKNKVKKNSHKEKKSASKGGALKSFMSIFKNEILHFVVGILLAFFGIFLTISLTSFFFTGNADQSIVESLNNEISKIEPEIKNWGGAIGAYLANSLINKWIGLAAFVFSIWIAITGLYLMRVVEKGYWKTTILCMLSCILLSLLFGFLYNITGNEILYSWGGNHGKVISEFMLLYIGKWGTGLVILIFFILLLIMISRSTITFIRQILTHNPFRNPFKRIKEEPKKENDNVENESEKEDNEPEEDEEEDTFVFVTEEDNTPEVNNETGEENDSNNPVIAETPGNDNDDTNVETDEENQPQVVVDDKIITNNFENNNDTEVIIDTHAIIPSENNDPTFTVVITPEEELVEEVIKEYDPTLDLPHYRMPHLDLLAPIATSNTLVEDQELEENQQLINKTLNDYGIEIVSINANVGPTVTLYEIVPAPRVRIAKIKSLEDDIALRLAALGIRIIAPIPGKGTIGIEVPNKTPQTVSMRSIIASRKFQESKYELPIALGKTITNEVFIGDLTKMPHVLVAGATGQGKSVGLNAIITSLLYKKHPAELKFVLVDPKKVEFSIYSAIERHFLAKLPDAEEPIITDTSKVVQTLQSVTHEMEMRYELLKQAKVRNIKEYNTKFKSRLLSPANGHRFLPYIVVVIDEFSDLIMTAGKEVESPIIRIAQLARAVGIHMIIATQRPSTNVITGIIKANFPARIAFRVQSMIDSRTILDCPGANQLIGRGDMLISQGGEMVRVQCAFVDTPEVEDICNYINEQQGYPSAFLLPEYVGEENSENGIDAFDCKDRDPLFEEAARIIVSSQQASTSSLQRRYKIGYNRAGRLMDQLEAAGIVGPAMGGRPREVLVSDIMQLENRMENIK